MSTTATTITSTLIRSNPLAFHTDMIFGGSPLRSVLLLVGPLYCCSSFSFHAPQVFARNSCVVVDDDFTEEAQRLAKDLQLPTSSQIPDGPQCFHHFLRLVPHQAGRGTPTYALSLEKNEHVVVEGAETRRRRPRSKSKALPFFVDFCPPEDSRLGMRCQKGSEGDLLVKAIGMRKLRQSEGIIFDLTAGIGQDSLLLAMSGAEKVYMVERHAIVVALLRDAFRRLSLQAKDEAQGIKSDHAFSLLDKLNLYEADSVDLITRMLKEGNERMPDVVYLDPMFPPRKKAAKVKKGMSLLHSLLDSQRTDEVSEAIREKENEDLLNVAYQCTVSRVVVKRPTNASPLGINTMLRPSYSIDGSVSRWDVYVKS